jgi:hypothetical protein
MRSYGRLSLPLLLLPAMAQARPGASLDAGTPVPLILMKRLSSGGVPAGSEVPLMVAEDVKAADGTVVIKQGTLAVAKVVSSKGLGMLSLPGSHARLNLMLDQTWTADGQAVELCCDPKKPKEEFQFTRDNTGKPAPIPGLDKLWTDAAMQRLLTQAASEIGEGHAAKWTQSPRNREEFAKAAAQMNLSKAAEAMKADSLADVYKVFHKLQAGGITKMVASTNPISALTAHAALEMARLTDSVQSRVAGTLKRRNITAHVGTPVTAYLAKPVALKQ